MPSGKRFFSYGTMRKRSRHYRASSRMHLGLLPGQSTQRVLVWLSRDSFFSDDGGDVFRGGHIKRRILNFDAVRNHLPAGNVSDLAGVPLLDGNLAAICASEVDR